MIELFISLNIPFTKCDKEKCLPIIEDIIELSLLARREGLLALEKEMENEKNFLLKTAIELIVDGTDPELVSQILKCLIIAGKYTGYELISRFIMAEGVISIQLGENPRIIALKLYSMLGEEYVAKMPKKLFVCTPTFTPSGKITQRDFDTLSQAEISALFTIKHEIEESL